GGGRRRAGGQGRGRLEGGPRLVPGQPERTERDDPCRGAAPTGEPPAGGRRGAAAIATGLYQLLHQRQRLQSCPVPTLSRVGLRRPESPLPRLARTGDASGPLPPATT